MYRFITFCFVIISMLMLSGCSFMSQKLTDISNKNAGSLTSEPKPQAGSPAQKCNQWCHNGWCSTHCEAN